MRPGGCHRTSSLQRVAELQQLFLGQDLLQLGQQILLLVAHVVQGFLPSTNTTSHSRLADTELATDKEDISNSDGAALHLH